MSSADVSARPLSGMEDVLAVHRFLSDVYLRTRSGRTWEVRRWEGRFWHDDPSELAKALARPQSTIRIWESPDGRIVGVVHPEGRGEAHLEVDPDHPGLEEEMLAWAEAVLPVATEDGGRRLTTFSLGDDEARRSLLRTRGYSPEPWAQLQRWCSLERPPPTMPLASGYELRSIVAGDADDARRLADLINAAFGHDFGPEALMNFERAPTFDADLQMIAVASDGTVGSHAGVNLDRRTMLAIVEPVCTHPEHRRRGLAAACMSEGLRRARGKGATRATVSTGSDNPSNRVYERLGFTDMEVVEAWSRTWPVASPPSPDVAPPR